MGTGTSAYLCGCSITQLMGGGGIVSVVVCPDHGCFDGVRRGFRLLTQAIKEAHDQLPITPEPPRAA